MIEELNSYLTDAKICYEYMYDRKPSELINWIEVEFYRTKVYFGFYSKSTLESSLSIFNNINDAMHNPASFRHNIVIHAPKVEIYKEPNKEVLAYGGEYNIVSKIKIRNVGSAKYTHIDNIKISDLIRDCTLDYKYLSSLGWLELNSLIETDLEFQRFGYIVQEINEALKV